jgi:hypothetical protein
MIKYLPLQFTSEEVEQIKKISTEKINGWDINHLFHKDFHREIYYLGFSLRDLTVYECYEFTSKLSQLCLFIGKLFPTKVN